MVVRVDLYHLAAHYLGNVGPVADSYLVRGLPLGGVLPVFEEVILPLRRKVLIERPPKGHVQDLHPPADPEDRYPAPKRQPYQRHLESIPLGERHPELGHRLLPVIAGVQVATTAQEQAVDLLNHRLSSPLIPRRRYHHGCAPGPRHALDVVEVRSDELAQRPLRDRIRIVFLRRRYSYYRGQAR